jgi:hypothetical protein
MNIKFTIQKPKPKPKPHSTLNKIYTHLFIIKTKKKFCSNHKNLNPN